MHYIGEVGTCSCHSRAAVAPGDRKKGSPFHSRAVQGMSVMVETPQQNRGSMCLLSGLKNNAVRQQSGNGGELSLQAGST